MTNREKFREVFNKDIHWSRGLEPQILALKSAHIDGIDCMEEWLNSEYTEPQVEIDNKKITPWYLEPFKQAIETLGSNNESEESMIELFDYILIALACPLALLMVEP